MTSNPDIFPIYMCYIIVHIHSDAMLKNDFGRTINIDMFAHLCKEH